MDTVDLDDATAELYALTPADFTPRRAELVAQARQEGSKALARAISELRRPTVSAWLVNQLARGAGDSLAEVEELAELGADLRAAQAQFDGPRMKDLAKRRHELVASLVRRAESVAHEAGQKVSSGVQRELEETLGAAVADEQASLAVTSGRLTRALVHAGFGAVDVTAATATPVTRHLSSAPKPEAGKGDSTTRQSPRKDDRDENRAGDREREAAAKAARQAAEEHRQALEATEIARADEAAAVEDLEAAARHRDEVRARESDLTRTLEELQREIVRVRHELDDLTRSIAAADRDHQRRERQLDQARKARRQAEQALERLDQAAPAEP